MLRWGATLLYSTERIRILFLRPSLSLFNQPSSHLLVRVRLLLATRTSAVGSVIRYRLHRRTTPTLLQLHTKDLKNSKKNVLLPYLDLSLEILDVVDGQIQHVGGVGLLHAGEPDSTSQIKMDHNLIIIISTVDSPLARPTTLPSQYPHPKGQGKFRAVSSAPSC